MKSESLHCFLSTRYQSRTMNWMIILCVLSMFHALPIQLMQGFSNDHNLPKKHDPINFERFHNQEKKFLRFSSVKVYKRAPRDPSADSPRNIGKLKSQKSNSNRSNDHNNSDKNLATCLDASMPCTSTPKHLRADSNDLIEQGSGQSDSNSGAAEEESHPVESHHSDATPHGVSNYAMFGAVSIGGLLVGSIITAFVTRYRNPSIENGTEHPTRSLNEEALWSAWQKVKQKACSTPKASNSTPSIASSNSSRKSHPWDCDESLKWKDTVLSETDSVEYWLNRSSRELPDEYIWDKFVQKVNLTIPLPSPPPRTLLEVPSR